MKRKGFKSNGISLDRIERWHIQENQQRSPGFKPDYGHYHLLDFSYCHYYHNGYITPESIDKTLICFGSDSFHVAIDKGEISIGFCVDVPLLGFHMVTVLCSMKRFTQQYPYPLKKKSHYFIQRPIEITSVVSPGDRYLSADKSQWVVPFRAKSIVIK